MLSLQFRDLMVEQREIIAQGVRILVREGLIPNAGHISYRPEGADWFWTLRHLHVGLDTVGPGDVIRCDLSGNAIDSQWEASGERFIYTETFKRRPELRAIAHFHPTYAIALSVAGQPLLPILMLGAHVGDVPQYDVPEPVEHPADGQALADALGSANATLMRGHGAITVGESVEDVVAMAVILEQSARIQHLAAMHGKVKRIDLHGREAIFKASFRHFREVLWDHHRQPGPVAPFLRA